MYINLNVVFGFAETVFTEPEQGQDYQIQAGFLSGRPDTGIALDVTLVEGSAGINALIIHTCLIIEVY